MGGHAIKNWVLLDRDGTIIVNRHYQKDPAATELLPGAREGLDRLRRSGFGLVLISNQSGVGRGIMTGADVEAVNASVVAKLGGDAKFFAGAYYCPHVEADGCGCRKPKPGLAARAATELGFSPGKCWVVGDRDIDIAMGRAFGAAGCILTRTGYGAETETAGKATPDFVADNLAAAAEWIIGMAEKR
ncbi:MAG: HAD-IIIA family hydrolase [Planctomycetota bacterium]|jgi:D-glycero-D-manno-heptose 1,7-bisphosphate phosphatase|nr:HAD-IIIA family hydrolase [Planctomycetota bacterium]